MHEMHHQQKVIGHVTRLYVTERFPKHFFAIYQGFGISQDVLEKLRQTNIERVRIVYHGSQGKRIYETTLSKFILHGKMYDDMGDKQRVLPIKDMEEYKLQ